MNYLAKVLDDLNLWSNAMIDDFNLVLLSGGFYRCDATWSKPATGIDQCYKVYFPVSGAAYLEMDDECYTLSRNDSVGMGSAGRWPAVFGGPPNTSGDTDWKNQTVFLATQPDGRRRAGDDRARAARSPRSTASLRLSPQRIYFISGFRLKQQICPERMDVYWTHFVPESLYLRYLLDQLPPVCSWSRRSAAASYREICDLFDLPFTAQSRPRKDTSPATECRIQALLLGLIARLLETLDQGRVQAFQPEYYRLKNAFDFMQTHFRENPPLETIAAQVGLAPNYFHRRFRKLFGTTPFNFMLAQRLNHARHLLGSTTLSVKEIAAAVGYDDPTYFSRVFAQQMEMPASEYRVAHCRDATR
jgi:AraC-like DNA-binding protein